MTRSRLLPLLSCALLARPSIGHAWTPNGATWGDVPHLSLILDGPDSAPDEAGMTKPWNWEAGFAAAVWGDSWYGTGNEVPGASFIYNWNFDDQDWCDTTTPDSNAVEWGLPSPLGLLTPCNPGTAWVDAVAITYKHDVAGRVSNTDTLFNVNLPWTTATDPTTDRPFNLRSVAMHEFGHALGLDHEDDTLAVMNTHHHYSAGLHADDRRGLRARYPGSATETDVGPSIWKKTDGDWRTSASLVSSPTFAVAGQTIAMEWTQENFGTVDATFDVGFHLSSNDVVSPTDTLLGTSTGAFEFAGQSSTHTRTVTVPSGTPAGTYFLGVCFDNGNALAESRENNNCVAYPATISIARPADLVITALSNPPAAANAGGSFGVTDTTANSGSGSANGAYFTGYRLRSTSVPAGSPVPIGQRSMPTLAPGASSNRTVTVTVPTTLASGTYSLEACADQTGTVFESNETNNCRTAATNVQITRLTDLAAVTVSDPPPSASAGSSFSVTDSTRNLAAVAAPASTTRYRLSRDTTISASDPLLTGSRAVPALTNTGPNTGTVTVTVPTSVAAATYYLAACADDPNAIEELDETNNCALSPETFQVTKPNLRVTAVSNPPAAVSVGTGFGMRDTTENVGAASAGASTTRYRLSADASIWNGPPIGPVDPLLPGTSAVPALPAGAGASNTISVSVPSSVASGVYYVGACADDGGSVVAESNELDNCLASATTVRVTNPANIADMVIDLVGVSAPSVAPGGRVDVTDTTLNNGNGSSVASATSYWLSTDSNITAADTRLGERAVAILAAGARSNGAPVSVTIPATVSPGSYFIGACADDRDLVVETSESNNCRTTAIAIR